MTDEEAAAILERWHWNSRDLLPDASQAKADIRALLAERAALREIVRAVADGRVIFGHVVTMDGIDAPNYVHWMTQARALLGMSREDGQP